MVAHQHGTPAGPAVPESVDKHPAWFRLIDQRDWYDRKSQHAQRWYKRLKIAQVALAVAVPATSLLPSAPCRYDMWTASAFGLLIAVLEAIQQMNQYSSLWFSYRATAERLKHEQYLFLAGGGPYRAMTEAERLVLLSERVEEHVSTEHANWFHESRKAATAPKPAA